MAQWTYHGFEGREDHRTLFASVVQTAS